MRHFRKKSPSVASPANGPQPTPTPPIVGYIKQELATFYPRTKDKRALAASSSAIALSIASPFCDLTDVALEEPGSSEESLWKAAYGAAKMAVDIAKDTSDMLPPLKGVMVALSVLIKNYDQTADNVAQIREVKERIEMLDGILKYPVGDQDTEQKAWRETLRRKLAGIMAELEPLSEQHGIMNFFKSVDHAKILNGFVQNLACAVTDYQTCLQQGIHKNTEGINKTANAIEEITKRIDETTKKIGGSAQNMTDAADHELLERLNPVYDAGYKAGHHDTCLRGTRESVLDGIMQWAEDPQDRHLFWLNGLAGTGKSTIAQTFSERVAKAGILGASFFCSRDYLERRELKNIFPTLAYQLSCRYPAFRRHVIQAIKEDPTVARNSLISQLEDLIVGPLSSSNISCVIVVDALDECIDDQPASAILSVLGRHVEQLSSAKFFITGRPEPRIRTGFRLPLLQPLTQVFLLHEVKPSDVDEDIQLYLQEKLTAVSKRRSDLDLSDPWPCGEDVTILTKKSSGLFIFASTLVRFIESEHHEPNERLQLIIASSDNTTHEGRAGIDPLYTQILVHAFLDVKDATVFTTLRRVLGAVVLAFNPLSQVQIAGILGVKTHVITRSLRHLHSVLLVPNEDSKEVRLFHKSFPDFLQDPERCSDQRFFVDSSVHHGDIALDCLELLKPLKSNPCDLPDFAMNQDVVDVPEALENKVGGATRYACGHWAMHVQSSPTTDDYATRLIPSATEFFEKNAVPWIEVMSLENRLESVIHSIYQLLDWLGVVHVPTPDLRSLVQDCLRFTMHFFPLLQQSASQIYHSALPLSPTSSKFHSWTLEEKTRITEFHGRPDAWGMVVRTITAGSKRFTCMTTFGHRIAAACDDGSVGIYDSITGVLRLSLGPTNPVQAIRGSPGGSVLFCAHKTPSVTVWDLQTGGPIHTLALERNVEDIAVSSKGRFLACGLTEGPVNIWEVTKGIEGPAIWTSSAATCFCWLGPEEHLVISTGALVDIWDIVAGTILRSFTLRYPTDHMVYSPKYQQLALVTSLSPGSAITLVNFQTGTFITSSSTHHLSCFAFSETTDELVYGTEANGIQLFNTSTRRWRNIEYPDTMTSVSFLPNGTVAANFAGSGLQLLNLDEGYTTPQQSTPIPALIVHAFDEDRIIAVLPTSRDRIVLLEASTMSQLFTIPAQSHTIPTDRITIVCASLNNRVAVYCFEEGGEELLQLWEFEGERPMWTVGIDLPPSIGAVSPFGAGLVTFHDMGDRTCICSWDPRNGQLKSHFYSTTHPRYIEFLSETIFASYSQTDRKYYDISPSLSETLISSIFVGPPRPVERRLDVDDTYEWVVGDSKRICWIPPGYIRPGPHSYCWAGPSIVMAGQDGILRKLTFREPS